MEIFNFSSKNQTIYFIGIGGVSMSALAKYLTVLGFNVAGSDLFNKELSQLEQLGIKIYHSHKKENIKGYNVIVYSSAISEDNEELREAKKLGLTLIKRSELLGQIANGYANSIGVSGSHGKTTATAMLFRIFNCANLNPTMFLGGEDKEFGNFYYGQKNYIITEVCEYKKNLLDIPVNVSVILNIDNDHMDSYKDIPDMIETFQKFGENSLIITNADDKNCNAIQHSKTLTFGINNLANFMAKNITKNELGYSFTAYAYGKRLGRINLKVLGKHNVYNALSSIAVASFYNIAFEKQKQALESFYGVQRRNEYLGELNGLNVYADYAHHPKEIEATITAFTLNQKEYLSVFQPHTYSRTEFLMNDFIAVLSKVNDLIIYKTYSAREKYNKRGSALTLYKNLIKHGKKDVYYARNKKQLGCLIKKLNKKHDSALFLGAGDIYFVAKNMVE